MYGSGKFDQLVEWVKSDPEEAAAVIVMHRNRQKQRNRMTTDVAGRHTHTMTTSDHCEYCGEIHNLMVPCRFPWRVRDGDD